MSRHIKQLSPRLPKTSQETIKNHDEHGS